MWRGIGAILLAGPVAVAGGAFITEENDTWLEKDRNYTQGAEIGFRRDLQYTRGEYVLDSWSVRNLMYTPRDITIAEPQPDDRPWAGYTGICFDRRFASASSVFNRYSVLIGVTGDWSASEHFQKWVHKQIDSKQPEGWANQIPEEVFANVKGECGVGVFSLDWNRVRVVDVDLIGGGDVGTGFIDAYGFGGLKVGYGAPSGWSFYNISPAGDAGGAIKLRRLYLAGQVGATAVAHNLMLGGSLFQDGPESDMEWLVGEVRVGIGAELVIGGKTLDLRVARISRTREFEGQEGSTDTVSIMLSWGGLF